VSSAPDNPTNPSGADVGPSADDGSLSVPVEELHRLAQIFDAAAEDVDAAVNRLHRSLRSTVLSRDDPDFSPRSIVDGTVALRAALRPVTAQLRADAGLMAATASEVVEADAATDTPEADGGDGPTPGQIDETAGWVGRVTDGLHRSGRPLIDTATGADRPGVDPVWDRVSKSF
jgi:hypothetical protein